MGQEVDEEEGEGEGGDGGDKAAGGGEAAAMDAEDSCSPMTSRANLGRLLCVVIPTSPSLKIEKTA